MRDIVFDLYGTLVDISTDESSQKFWKRFTGYAARTFGAGEGLEREYNALLGAYGGYDEPDICAVLALAIERCGGSITASGPRQAAEMFRSLSTRRLKLYKGAKDLLETLCRCGARLYILSNAQEAFTMPELEKLDVLQYFRGVELSSQFGQKKPSPAFFGHIISKYSLNAENTVYVGNDIEADIIPAAALKMKTAYYYSDISPETDSVESGAAVAGFATDNFGRLGKYLIGQIL